MVCLTLYTQYGCCVGALCGASLGLVGDVSERSRLMATVRPIFTGCSYEVLSCMICRFRVGQQMEACDAFG